MEGSEEVWLVASWGVNQWVEEFLFVFPSFTVFQIKIKFFFKCLFIKYGISSSGNALSSFSVFSSAVTTLG